ncbi:MAG: hypothetical protein ACTSQI_03045 [Candidatus Helarchaeota archaeon]
MNDNSIADRFIISSEEIIGEWDWRKKEKCSVCNLPIKSGAKTGGCPYCGHRAHLDHILEWIKIKGICPHCKRKLRAEKLIKNEGKIKF